MAFKEREEIVGKQFVAIEGNVKVKKKDFDQWNWICGVVRAVSERDHKTCDDVQVLIEEEHKPWSERRWIKIHQDCQYFAVEKSLVWAPFPDETEKPVESTSIESTVPHTYVPALNFTEIVDKLDYVKQKIKRPVKSLLEQRLTFTEPNNITPYQESGRVTGPLDRGPASGHASVPKTTDHVMPIIDAYISSFQESGRVTGPLDDGADQQAAVRAWREQQDGQKLLVETPSILVGYRVEVYRHEGTTQWYTAVIHSYNDKTNELEVTDDTVLEEHTEDPATVQIRLIGHGVVESILRGEQSRVRPTRTRRSLENKTPPSAATCSKPGSALSERLTRRGQSQSPCTVRSSTPLSGRKSTTPRNTQPADGVKGEKKRKQEPSSVDIDNTKLAAALNSNPGTPQDLLCSTPRTSASPLSVHSDTSSTLSENSASDSSSQSSVKSGQKRSLVVPLFDISSSPKHSKPNKISKTKNLAKHNKLKETKQQKPCDNPTPAKLNKEKTKPVKDNLSKTNKPAASKNSEKEKPVRLKNNNEKKGKKNENRGKFKESADISAENDRLPQNKQAHCDTPQESKSKTKNQHTNQHNNSNEKKVKSKNQSKQTESLNKSSLIDSKCVQNTSLCKSIDISTSETTSQPRNTCLKAALLNETSTSVNQSLLKATLDTSSVINRPPPALGYKTADKLPTQAKTDSKTLLNPKPEKIECVTAPSVENYLRESNTSGSAVSVVSPRSAGPVQSNKPTAEPADLQVASLSSRHLNTDSVVKKKLTKSRSDECLVGKLGSVTHKAAQKTNAFRTLLSSLPSQQHHPSNEPATKVGLHSLECKAPPVDSKDMHYKKYLLGDYQKKEGGGGQTSPVKADEADRNPSHHASSRIDLQQGINLNQSLTDQIARRNKDGGFGGAKAPEVHRTWQDTPIPTSRTNGIEPVTSSRTSNSGSHSGTQQQTLPKSASTREVPKDSKSYDKKPGMDTHAPHHSSSHDERAPRSSSQPPVKAGPSSHPSSQSYENSNSNPNSAAAADRKASPLLVDKNKRVEPYRDPELLKRDEMQRIAALQAQQQQQQQQRQATPLSQASASQLSAAAAASVAALSGLPTTRPQGLIGLAGYPANPAAALAAAGLQAPLSLHQFTGALDPAAMNSLSLLQQQATLAQLHQLQLLQSQQPHLVPYAALQNSMQTRQLELLWQQKYPNISIPPGWILHQYQDELLRDVNPLMQQRELIDRDRREREIALEREHELREMRDREHELRELRDREERERAERERIERDRAERDRQERERQERERREREDRERREKEAAQLRERERQRREILHESKATADAVEKHFQESLRLASQKAYSRAQLYAQSMPQGSQLPPGAGGLAGKPFPHPLPMSHGHAHSQHSPLDRKPEEKPRLAHSASPHERTPSNISPQDLSQKPHPSSADSADVKPDIKHLATHPKLDFAPGFPAFAAHLSKAGAVTSQSSTASSSSSTGGHQIKHEPNFSLYGYQQPSALQQMYISQDKLLAQGLKDEKNIKSEPSDRSKQSLASPPPLVKNENKSVIVENKGGKDSLPASHGHGSISQGTSRAPYGQQTDNKGSAARPNQSSAAQHPLRVSSPQQLNKPASSQAAATLAQSQVAAQMAMQQAYMAAISQAGAGAVAFTHALQQGLVPNPGYSSQQLANAAAAANAAAKSAQPSSRNEEQISPGGTSSQKRRAPQAPQPKMSGDNQPKKPRVEAMTGTNPPPSSTSPANRPAAGPPGPNQQGSFIGCFKTFVENTVTSAFYHDQVNGKQTQAGMAPQSAGQVVTAQTVVPARMGGNPQALPPPAVASNMAKPMPPTSSVNNAKMANTPTSNTETRTVDSKSIPVTKASSAMDVIPGGRNSPAVNNALNSIQESINRVANGNPDTDSDTLSAPSPPLNLGNKDAPSPARSTSSNSAGPRNMKKALLQRYSDEKVPANQAPITPSNSSSSLDTLVSQNNKSANNKDNSGGSSKSLPASAQNSERNSPMPSPAEINKRLVNLQQQQQQQDKQDPNKTCSPTSAPVASTTTKPNSNSTNTKSNIKSPLTLLKEKESEEATNTSASEAESQDEAVKKPKKKGQKRKADANKSSERSSTPVGSSTNKKAKDSTEGSANNSGTTSESNASENKTKKGNIKSPASDAETASSKETKKKKKGSNKKNEDDDNKTSSTTSTTATNHSSSNSTTSTNHSNSKPASTTTATKSTGSSVPNKSSWHCERKMVERQEALNKQNSGGSSGGGGKKSGKKEKDEPLNEVQAAKKRLAKLRKTQEPFLQEESCMEVAPKLTKCRECKLTPTQMDKKQPNIFCRFYAFRRLRYNARGIVNNAGFSEPSDADVEDIDLWYPRNGGPSLTGDTTQCDTLLSVDMARYLMQNVGDRFCELVEQEKEAMMWVSPDTKIVWKRAVQGVREMCDVCETTLFNMHWCCHKCGFVVCIDCYRNKTKKVGGNQDKHMREEAGHVTNQKWLTCSASRQQHEADKLRITQIIPSDVLWALGSILHEVRDDWNIPSNCPCGHRSQNKSRLSRISHSQQNGLSNNHVINNDTKPVKPSPFSSLSAAATTTTKPLVNGIDSAKKKLGADIGSNNMSMMSPLNLLAEAAVSRESEIKKENEQAANKPTPSSGDKCSTLRDLLTRHGVGMKAPPPDYNKKPKGISANIDDVLLKLTESKGGESHGIRNTTFSHYVPRSGCQMQGRAAPIPTYTLAETRVLFPDVEHSWLDDGRLLRLIDPKCARNLSLFQQQWRRAQPVLVSNCHDTLSSDLWTPIAFGKEFGHQENDLVNCHNLVTIVGHKMKVFWEGFEKMSCRLKDNKGNPIIVKLKDWPPTEDFSELMPARFKNLMQALPLPEYTQRNGTFNLASRLPEFFVKPDLGPKMYNAYGSALHPKTGTTNLHLDVSDAVNLMVYVGIPTDDEDRQELAAVDLLERAGCCEFTMARVREGHERPGALWHIFDPQDADKIRELLNKVAKESGEEVSLDNDPIHDQSFYLDLALRERLLKEYDVQGYTIVQFMGDAVFIPAGAPHQVQNLHSCIKAAEDFVSPENVNHCFFLTQEFRHLSDQHSNHEDKLQIKNIIYHAVKDAVAVLKNASANQDQH